MLAVLAPAALFALARRIEFAEKKGIAALRDPISAAARYQSPAALAHFEFTSVSPLYLLLAAAALAEPHLAFAPALADQTPVAWPTAMVQPPLDGLSTIEPLPAVPPLAAAEEIQHPPQPMVVLTDSPESQWLASWQSGYLRLIGDDGRALAGFYDPFTFQFAYGAAGVQPYRLGWYSYNDYVLMSSAPTTIGGNFRDQQWNAWIRYARLNRNSTVFTWTGWGNGKFWAGPTGTDLPATAIQLISDFQLASAYSGPWNWQVGFTPQLNGSWERDWNANALMADARAVLFYRASPQWLIALGAAYWNRATDRLIPYGGLIWAPDDRWEFRFMFPRSRASYYIGRLGGADTWLYASGEYTVEAYQVDLDQPPSSNRGEISDYRVLVGASATAGIWTMFFEGGLVTDRHFRFRGDATDFAIDDCAMLRTGLLF